MDAKSLFLRDSGKYRPISSELIKEWTKNKSKVLRKLNKPKLNQPFSKFINEHAKPLDKKIFILNDSIREDKNSEVKIKILKDGSSTWTLPYTKKLIELNNPFYSKLSPVNIIQVLRFVNQKTQFMEQFTHIKPHYSKSKRDEVSVSACLIANATNLGILKMSDICDINFATLNTTDKNYIRLSTLRASNDVISNAIADLAIFRYWNFQADLLHASLDGQKFKTNLDTLLARYSKKYFGFDKGVVAYTMIANHIPINAKIIGANEHESRYLFDLVYNNMSKVRPDIYIPKSKQHISFWEMMLNESNWEETKKAVYNELKLPNKNEAKSKIIHQFNNSVNKAKENFNTNSFAKIEKGKLILKRDDKAYIPDSVSSLQKVINTSMPFIRIEQLLMEVDKLTNFSQHFTPIQEHASRP